MPPRPANPVMLPMGHALDQSATLSQLLQRVRESRDHLAAMAPHLPPGLAGQVRPGPLDSESWLLLVSSGSAAAKLRQSLPTLLDAMRTRGWQGTSIKVRVQPPPPEGSRGAPSRDKG